MVFARRTLIVAGRVLRELFRDPRSRVILVITPGLLLIFVRYLFASAAAFSPTGTLMIGVFPVFTLCLLGSTALVRERTAGTLEKILTTPITKANLVCGYACAAAVAALAQAVVTVTVAFAVVKIHTTAVSPFWLIRTAHPRCAACSWA